MLHHYRKKGLVFLCLAFILPACTRNSAVETYTTHLDEVVSLVQEYEHNTDITGAKVLEYVKAHQQEIEGALSELASFSDKDVAAFYPRVMRNVDTLREILKSEVLIYPDSVRDQIRDILKENDDLITRKAAELTAGNRFFLTGTFARFSVELAIVKELVDNVPLEGYHLTRNKDFIEAAKILAMDNLLGD